MPDRRKHRGAHPADEKLFASDQIPKLSLAVHDLSWLIGKGYGEKACLKLVGDRYRLKQRQRLAISRVVCTEIQCINRNDKALAAKEMQDKEIWIDGLNLIITIESALSGGFIFEGLDGCYRDLASIHGTYKRVEETQEAIHLIGKALCSLKTNNIKWLLDKPVSNSGRMKTLLLEISKENQWSWSVELVNNPDSLLMQTDVPIVSSDSLILDYTQNWFNLSRFIIDKDIPTSRILHFTI